MDSAYNAIHGPPAHPALGAQTVKNGTPFVVRRIDSTVLGNKGGKAAGKGLPPAGTGPWAPAYGPAFIQATVSTEADFLQ